MTPAPRISRSSGFTLIELLVVVLIIAILIAIAAPSFLGQTAKAEDSAAEQYLAVAYQAAKADSVTREGQWGDSAPLAAAIGDSEPEDNLAVGVPAPADVSTGGRVNILAVVNGETLTLSDRSGSGHACILVVDANKAPAINCEAAGSYDFPIGVPVDLSQRSPQFEYDPVLDEDSSTVYFDSEAAGGGSEIMQMPLYPGAGAYPVSTGRPDGGQEYSPQLAGSPASELYFSSDRSGTLSVWKSALTGSGPSQVTTAASDGSLGLDAAADKVCYRSAAGALIVKDIGGGSATVDTAVEAGCSFSPDGSQVAYAKSGQIYVADSSGAGSPSALGTPPGSWAEHSPAFSPDGSKIAFTVSDGSGDWALEVADASSGAIASTPVDFSAYATYFKVPAPWFGDVSWSSAGDYLLFSATATAADDQDVWVLRLS